MKNLNTDAYIGRKRECGCCVMVCSTDANMAREVADAIRGGLLIDRVSIGEYRENISREPTFMKCPHKAGQMELAI